MANQKTYDFSGVSDLAAAEFYRQGELYLDNQVKIGLAADARATTSSSIFAAAAAGILIVSANIANTNDKPHVALIFTLVTAGLFFAVSSAFCAFAARPKAFFHPGHSPDLLYTVATTEARIKLKMAEKIQARIDINRSSLDLAAKILRWGQNIAALAPIASLFTFFWLHRLSF